MSPRVEPENVALLPAKLAFFRSVPALASAVVHVGLYAAVGGHASPSNALASSTDAVEIAIDTAVTPAPTPVAEREPEPEAPARNVAAPSRVAPTHKHSYPVPPSHDATPHDPSHVHVPLGAPVSALAQESAAAPLPVFAIAMKGTNASATRTAAGTGTGTGLDSEAVVEEAMVSVSAKLVASAPATYPLGARSDEVEADVPVELVLDTAGRVTDAKIVRRAGHGFDESALAAVRAYRFTPAQRAGVPVRVRMRWVVQFRLH